MFKITFNINSYIYIKSIIKLIRIFQVLVSVIQKQSYLNYNKLEK